MPRIDLPDDVELPGCRKATLTVIALAAALVATVLMVVMT